jgi:hypothetical protein
MNSDPLILKRNINYAILAMKDSSKNYNEIPYLSHLLLTQTVVNNNHVYVDDTIVDPFGIGRELALNLTNELRKRVDKIVFYVNFGYSNGMKVAQQIAITHGIPIEERYLGEELMLSI